MKKLQAVELFNKGWSKSKIADELGVSRRTVGRWLNGVVIEPEIDSQFHANRRAETLKNILLETITQSKYPVINPESIIVESRVDKLYSHISNNVVEQIRAPRTYVTDILKVAPITNPKNKTFIFSRVQNSTPIHEGLWENILAYAEARNAQIVLGPDTYETSWWDESNYHCRSYDDRIKEYLCFGRMDIGNNFFFAGEMNILTTASSPISDLIGYSLGKWCVVPHSKQQLQAIPSTDPNQLAHQILTTGSLTIPKVIPRKSGIKSIFHHIMGFVIVEFDEDGNIFCRHINAEDDGSFYDLWWRVEDGEAFNWTTLKNNEEHRPDYLMPGDVHRAKLDRANKRDVLGTFGVFENTVNHDNILRLLYPKRLILQDLHDGEIDNHHNKDDIHYKFELLQRDRLDLEKEIEGDSKFLESLLKMHPHLEEILIDESNHDLRVERYVRDGRYREDPHNLKYGNMLEGRYIEYREQVAEALTDRKPVPKFSLYEYAIRQKSKLPKVKWIYDGQSYVINDVEVGHHGFRGANGSKATHTGYVRMGRKISYGDKHSPAIKDGAFQAGVMVLQQGYNKGPSSWCVSHILQYANGKRCIITMQNGKFTNQ
jgi:predicted transcriptional regulator